MTIRYLNDFGDTKMPITFSARFKDLHLGVKFKHNGRVFFKTSETEAHDVFFDETISFSPDELISEKDA